MYTTVTGCSISNSATTTTTTMQAQPTSYDIFCSPGTCGTKECSKKRSIEESNSGNLEKRLWEKVPGRISQPEPGNWVEPSNYAAKVRIPNQKFIRGEAFLAYTKSESDPLNYASVEVSVDGFDADHPTTSKAFFWGDEIATVALTGMFGCTVIVIISTAGVWVVHFWEVPSFTGQLLQEAHWNDPVLHPPVFESGDAKRERFKRDVLDALHKGGSANHVFGLDDLRGDDKFFMFHDDEKPQIFLFGPRPMAHPLDRNLERPKFPGEFRYPDENQQITNELKSIFGANQPVFAQDYYPRTPSVEYMQTHTFEDVKKYVRDDDNESGWGNILIQYKPAYGCNNAAYRIWFHFKVITEKTWTPVLLDNPDDPDNPDNPDNPDEKRDDSSACTVSANASSTSVSASPTSTITSTPTTTISTASSSISLQATAPASPVRCYNSHDLPCYNAVAPDAAHSKSDEFCTDHASINWIGNGFGNGFGSWPIIQYAFNEFSKPISYNLTVSRKPNCEGGETNVGLPIPTFSCKDAMRLAVDGCDNENEKLGGTVEAGCLVYDFRLANKSDSTDCSLLFS
ncbi:hypothetical protein GGR54DRAFT_613591 [Hypoxylon sp. NC1633]|nr:hypothetical protein GGR54DRAFT_613591 [Hypoxylon sp. NC1633]